MKLIAIIAALLPILSSSRKVDLSNRVKRANEEADEGTEPRRLMGKKGGKRGKGGKGKGSSYVDVRKSNAWSLHKGAYETRCGIESCDEAQG